MVRERTREQEGRDAESAVRAQKAEVEAEEDTAKRLRWAVALTTKLRRMDYAPSDDVLEPHMAAIQDLSQELEFAKGTIDDAAKASLVEKCAQILRRGHVALMQAQKAAHADPNDNQAVKDVKLAVSGLNDEWRDAVAKLRESAQ